jgi:MFS family permease
MSLEFGWERGALSGAFSLMMIVGGVLAIFAGKLTDKYGPRPLLTISGLFFGIGFLLMSQVSSLVHMYLIWGIIMSIGFSSAFIPLVTTIPRWFTRRRGLAMGVTVAGYGFGAIITPSLTQWLISSYDWQHASITLGLVSMVVVIPAAQFMKHSPQRMGLRPYGEDIIQQEAQTPDTISSGLSLGQAVKTSWFWFFGLIIFGSLFCVGLLTVHIAPYAIDIGISAMIAASVISVFGGTSIIGRFASGYLSDKIGARRVLAICIIIMTLTIIWLLFARATWMFYLFAVVYGIAYGGIVPLYTLISVELFGLKFLGTISATASLLGMMGAALGAPTAGSIFDFTGSYHWALLICVLIGIFAAIISLILLRSPNWCNKKVRLP